MDRFGPTRKVSEKLVHHLSRSDRSEFWLNGSRPLTSITGETGLNYLWQA